MKETIRDTYMFGTDPETYNKMIGARVNKIKDNQKKIERIEDQNIILAKEIATIIQKRDKLKGEKNGS